MMTTVSVKDSGCYIDMLVIQWRQRQAYRVYKRIQHLRGRTECIKHGRGGIKGERGDYIRGRHMC